MNKRNVVFAAAIGFAIGYLVNHQVETQKKINPEKALKNAKETFKKEGPISGSWIYMKPEEVEKNGLHYQVYRGGITRNIDGQNKEYEFYIDTKTGAIISVEESA